MEAAQFIIKSSVFLNGEIASLKVLAGDGILQIKIRLKRPLKEKIVQIKVKKEVD